VKEDGMKGFTDMHHHMVYGIDDGPKTKEEMFAMLRLASKNRVAVIVATPHYKPGFEPFPVEKYRERLEEARQYSIENALEIEVLEGAELMYVPGITEQYLNDPLPTLADTRCVLVEFYPNIPYHRLVRAVDEISGRGYVPVLAHFERYRCLRWKVSRVLSLQQKFGALLQVNSSSILRRMNFAIWFSVRRSLKLQIVDLVATDAHNTGTRPCDMENVFGTLASRVGTEYAEELMGINGKSAIF
jgi:protein-tyrosine phosphatase